MGKICKDYSGYENNKPIGSGGFGKVYQYTKEFAIKKEYKVQRFYPFIVIYKLSYVFLFVEATYNG